MKVLFIGSLISMSEMEHLNDISTEKASVAPVNYETMLVKGLVENGIQVEALSVPAVAAFPNSKCLLIKKKNELLEGSIPVQWIPFVNFQVAKQISIKLSVYHYLKSWLKKNKTEKEKVVLMYSIYPPYTEPALSLCNKFGVHISTIITDLPEYMYSWKSLKGLRKWYSNHISKKMRLLQSRFNSYILFTELMANRIGVKDKPHIVSEGFCDLDIYNSISTCNKHEKFTIVYGGNLSKLYGIRQLVNAFMNTNIDAELHFYGAGSDSDYLSMCQEKDDRIKYFGRVSRQEMLIALKKAHLLVINKPSSDDYSNYSFSSKILEYMVSGTPVLTTRVGGMPKEYYPYFYFIDDESVDGISKAIKDIFCVPLEELEEKGRVAKEFALANKNYNIQTLKIVNFLNNVCINR